MPEKFEQFCKDPCKSVQTFPELDDACKEGDKDSIKIIAELISSENWEDPEAE